MLLDFGNGYAAAYPWECNQREERLDDTRGYAEQVQRVTRNKSAHTYPKHVCRPLVPIVGYFPGQSAVAISTTVTWPCSVKSGDCQLRRPCTTYFLRICTHRRTHDCCFVELNEEEQYLKADQRLPNVMEEDASCS